jgi:aspartate-semialdehyde dehydrogenase
VIERLPVAVLGATGEAGRQALSALAEHPWFEVVAVAASGANAGRRLGDVLDERSDTGSAVAARLGITERAGRAPLPAGLLDLRLQDAERFEASSVCAVFSMLPSGPARALEAACAATTPVFSTASAWRMDDATPLLLAGVNGAHVEQLAGQRRAHGWQGFVAPGPNCTTVGLAVTLAPLARELGVTGVHLTSLQAVSGAGDRAPQVAEAVAGNVLPHIADEEEKVECEAAKILGSWRDGRLKPAGFPVSATCTRVPVEDGHLLSISVTLEQPATPADVAAPPGGVGRCPAGRRAGSRCAPSPTARSRASTGMPAVG